MSMVTADLKMALKFGNDRSRPKISGAGTSHTIDEEKGVVECTVGRRPGGAYVSIVKNDSIDHEGFAIAPSNAGIPLVAHFEYLDGEVPMGLLSHHR